MPVVSNRHRGLIVPRSEKCREAAQELGASSATVSRHLQILLESGGYVWHVWRVWWARPHGSFQRIRLGMALAYPQRSRIYPHRRTVALLAYTAFGLMVAMPWPVARCIWVPETNCTPLNASRT
jgi:hypothetical protein